MYPRNSLLAKFVNGDTKQHIKIVLYALFQEKCLSFTDTSYPHIGKELLRNQEQFNKMMETELLENNVGVSEEFFEKQLCKFITLSCGTFIRTIEENQDEKFLLLSQQQLKLLKEEPCHILPFSLPIYDLTDDASDIRKMRDTFFTIANGSPTEKEVESLNLWKKLVENRQKRGRVQYFTNIFPKEFLAPAGAGKTLLIQQMLINLHQDGELSEEKKAMYRVSGKTVHTFVF